MSLTYLAVRHQTSKMKQYHSFRRSSLASTHEYGEDENNNTRQRGNRGNTRRQDNGGKDEETFSQAILYVIAYVSCYGFPFASTFIAGYPLPDALLVSTGLFYPLQGKQTLRQALSFTSSL